MALKLLGKDKTEIEFEFEKIRPRIDGINKDDTILVTNLITIDVGLTDVHELKDHVGVFLHTNKDSGITFSTDVETEVILKNMFIEGNLLGVVVDVPRDKFGK